MSKDLMAVLMANAGPARQVRGLSHRGGPARRGKTPATGVPFWNNPPPPEDGCCPAVGHPNLVC